MPCGNKAQWWQLSLPCAQHKQDLKRSLVQRSAVVWRLGFWRDAELRSNAWVSEAASEVFGSCDGWNTWELEMGRERGEEIFSFWLPSFFLFVQDFKSSSDFSTGKKVEIWVKWSTSIKKIKPQCSRWVKRPQQYVQDWNKSSKEGSEVTRAVFPLPLLLSSSHSASFLLTWEVLLEQSSVLSHVCKIWSVLLDPSLWPWVSCFFLPSFSLLRWERKMANTALLKYFAQY